MSEGTTAGIHGRVRHPIRGRLSLGRGCSADPCGARDYDARLARKTHPGWNGDRNPLGRPTPVSLLDKRWREQQHPPFGALFPKGFSVASSQRHPADHPVHGQRIHCSGRVVGEMLLSHRAARMLSSRALPWLQHSTATGRGIAMTRLREPLLSPMCFPQNHSLLSCRAARKSAAESSYSPFPPTEIRYHQLQQFHISIKGNPSLVMWYWRWRIIFSPALSCSSVTGNPEILLGERKIRFCSPLHFSGVGALRRRKRGSLSELPGGWGASLPEASMLHARRPMGKTGCSTGRMRGRSRVRPPSRISRASCSRELGAPLHIRPLKWHRSHHPRDLSP